MNRTTILQLIEGCLAEGYRVEIVKCGPHAKPGKPLLCRVATGGHSQRDHLVYGADARKIMREAMTHVLKRGFTQPQDRYGLRG